MIKELKSQLDSDQLISAASALKFWTDGSGAEMSITQSGGIPEIALPFRPAISEIATIRGKTPLHVMVNIFPPNIIAPIHIDAVKGEGLVNDCIVRLERWHLPLVTNDKCEWWDEINGSIIMCVGHWYGPMPYWVDHTFKNQGLTNRVHLIVDLVN